MSMPKDVLVLLSGGLDSTSLLAFARREGNRVGALSIAYEQRHSRELTAAERVAQRLSVPHWVIRLDRDVFPPSALTGEGEVPPGRYSSESIQQTEVPGRNLVFLALAASAAVARGFSTVGIAVHSGDHPLYADCQPEFIERVQKVFAQAFRGRVSLWAPFLHLSKGEIVQVGVQYGAPFELTYSCYRGGPSHCGVCATCLERQDAFRWAGFDDPTPYEFKEEFHE